MFTATIGVMDIIRRHFKENNPVIIITFLALTNEKIFYMNFIDIGKIKTTNNAIANFIMRIFNLFILLRIPI